MEQWNVDINRGYIALIDPDWYVCARKQPQPDEVNLWRLGQGLFSLAARDSYRGACGSRGANPQSGNRSEVSKG